MQNQNMVILVGNLGNDPEVRHFDNYSNIKFSLATSKKIKKNNEEKEFTQWHYVVCWNKRFIEIFENKNVKKGDRVYVHGEIQYSKWTDKQGVEKVSTSINADIMGILKQKEAEPENAFDKHDKEKNLESSKTPEYDVDSDIDNSDSDPF